MKRIITILVALMMCFSFVIVNAKEAIPAEAKSIFTLESSKGYLGETVKIKISLKCTEDINSIALSRFNYDENVFEFVSFSDYDHINDMTILPPSFDEDVIAISLALKETKKFSGTICTATFKINSNAEPGTYTISAEPLTKKKSDIVDSFTIPAEIVVSDRPKKDFPSTIKFEDKEVEYNGKEQSITVSGKLPAGTEVEYNNTNKATDAGEYKAEAILTAPGYNEKKLEANLTILPKAITASGVTAENKTYDGTDEAKISGGKIEGIEEGDDVNATCPETGKFASANAGNGISVTASDIVLSGADAHNYKIAKQPSLKANITPAPITVTADNKSMRKGDSLPELTYSVTDGELFDDNALSGKLATKANGSKTGEFDITVGTLKASANYKMTFIGGKLTVSDKKAQDVVIAKVDKKTYGDASFSIAPESDGNSELGTFTYKSSNSDIAEIDSNGNVIIKAAGNVSLTVERAGNDNIADFSTTVKLNVAKAKITVTANAATKRFGTQDPELTYTYTGELVGADEFTGALSRKSGEKIGKYAITIGTLSLGKNYDISFVGATFEITDKTPQNITVSCDSEKTYGDDDFKITVTPDAVSGLTAFTYESSNTNVIEVSADGTVTVKAAGEATITVKQAGNDEFAPFEKTIAIKVGKKSVGIVSLDLDNKTVIFDIDAEGISLDFDKLVIERVKDSEKVNVTGMVLTGEKAENYALTTESFETTADAENLVDITVKASGGDVEGAGTHIKNSKVTLTAKPNSGYSFDGYYVGTKLVFAKAVYEFDAAEDIELTAKFTRHSTGSSSSEVFPVKGGGNSGTKQEVAKITVTFDTNGGSTIQTQTISTGCTAIRPMNPVKDGYIFDGWYSDKELTKSFAFATILRENTTIYAKWAPGAEMGKRQFVLTVGSMNANVFGESKVNDVAPIVKNNRTMLPARFVAENLGATVEWDAENRVVTVKNATVTIKITIGSDIATVNGVEEKLDSPAFIENSRTYTPVRFIAEKLGATVEWNAARNEVVITKAAR